MDCEYNRLDKKVKKVDSLDLLKRTFKQIEEMIEEIEASDDEAKTVYPDIIIHRRLKQENLLIIEIKKTTSNEDKDNIDKAKLYKYKNQLRYKHTAFLKIKTGDSFNTSAEKDGAIDELKIDEEWIKLIE